jgi:hypothetical protein
MNMSNQQVDVPEVGEMLHPVSISVVRNGVDRIMGAVTARVLLEDAVFEQLREIVARHVVDVGRGVQALTVVVVKNQIDKQVQRELALNEGERGNLVQLK